MTKNCTVLASPLRRKRGTWWNDRYAALHADLRGVPPLMRTVWDRHVMFRRRGCRVSPSLTANIMIVAQRQSRCNSAASDCVENAAPTQGYST